MGLDVFALKLGEMVADGDADADEVARICDDADVRYIYAEHAERADGIASGWYRAVVIDAPGVSHSYSGYNAFRDDLCRAVHGIPAEQLWQEIGDGTRPDAGPFVELIHFSDCEGVLGQQVAAKLATDFDAHANTIHTKLTPYNAWRYDRWRALFRAAADAGGGVVLFT